MLSHRSQYVRTHVCLLRGINVGGNRLVKMAELKAMLEEAGLSEVATLLQSGNCVFCAQGQEDREIERELLAMARKRFGFAPEFFVRSKAEWAKIIEANPFPKAADHDSSHLLAVITHDAPDPDQVSAVAKAIQGPEQIATAAGCLYAVYPDGIGTSKVASTPGWRKLFEEGTGRNWNTVLKLKALLEASK